jgi:holo-[acyl-carrier protein] synthase
MRVGCDLVTVSRFEKLLANQHFLDRVFHPVERAYCLQQAKPIHHWAARFAAKEAFVKALGTGFYTENVTPDQVWVNREPNGRPFLCLSDHVLQLLNNSGFKSWDVSLSHHGDAAMAVVLLVP